MIYYTYMKKTFTYITYVLCAFSLVAIAVVTSLASTPARIAHAQSSTAGLTGWAWSSNIGWISFSGTAADGSAYGVSMNTTTPTSAPLSGYAWSDHIGWISFNVPAVGCPQTDSQDLTCPPTVNMTTGIVTGWARALTLAGDPNDGDGWIELSGTNHVSDPTAAYTSGNETYNGGVAYLASTTNPGAGSFLGMAWGSDDVGWLSFNVGVAGGNGVIVGCVSNCGPASSNPPLITIAADGNYPTDIIASYGNKSNLTWSVTNNPTSCTMTSSPANILPTGLVASTSAGTSSGIIGSATTFSLSCYNNSDINNPSSNSVLITTTTTSGGSNPGGTSGVSMWLDNNSGNPSVNPPIPAQTNVHIHPADKVTLNWDGTAFTDPYQNILGASPSCSGNQISGPSTVTSWTTGTLANQSPDNASTPFTLQGSSLTIGTYSLSLTCRATVTGVLVSSSSKPVTITVTNSSIHEQ